MEPVVEDALREPAIGDAVNLLPDRRHVQRHGALDEVHEVRVLLENALTPLPDPLLNAAVQREGLRGPEAGARLKGRDDRHVGGGHFAVFEANSLVVPKVTPDNGYPPPSIFFLLDLLITNRALRRPLGDRQIIQAKLIRRDISEMKLIVTEFRTSRLIPETIPSSSRASVNLVDANLVCSESTQDTEF